MISSVDAIFQEMRDKLQGVVPEIEWAYKAEMIAQIREWKQRRDALILGHNYMEPALYHMIPDFKGDSLELARQAARTDREVIVFCGVKFMAETAKILNPEKTVLLPSDKAGCSLAASITAEDVRRLKRRYPGVPVVSYVNTYAEVKAESDICCTSSNAVAVVESLKADTIIFLPDEFLARNVARETGKHLIVPRKSDLGGDASPQDTEVDAQIIGWPGRCEVHEQFSVADVEQARRQFPDVVVLAHPECAPQVAEAADFSGSTTAMIRYVKTSPAHQFLLLTECSMGDNIISAHPEKEIVRLCSVRCPHMNQITLEETLNALRFNRYIIEVEESIRQRALRAVQRMLEIG